MKQIAMSVTAVLSCMTMLAAPGAAQDAVQNPAPVRLASGGPDKLGWVSQVGERQGDRVRFWALSMPRQPTRLRNDTDDGRTLFYSYDVMAQLLEGDCSARQRLRRLRTEFYIGGVIHSSAPAPETLADSNLAANPASDAGIALTILCDNKPTATAMPTMEEARRVTDEYFKKKAAAAPGG